MCKLYKNASIARKIGIFDKLQRADLFENHNSATYNLYRQDRHIRGHTLFRQEERHDPITWVSAEHSDKKSLNYKNVLSRLDAKLSIMCLGG
jgi:hypothetical protein